MMRRRVQTFEEEEESGGWISWTSMGLSSFLFLCICKYQQTLNIICFYVIEDEIGEDLPFDDGEATGKIGTKKLKKLEMKAEKRAMRQVYVLILWYLDYCIL